MMMVFLDGLIRNLSFRLANFTGHKGRRMLWLQFPLPERSWTAPTLCILRGLLNLEIYLESRLIYSFGELRPAFINRFSSVVPHQVPLPDDFHGKTLFLRIYSDLPTLIGIDGSVHLGDKDSLLKHIIKGEVGQFLVDVFYIFFWTVFPRGIS